VKKIRAKLQSPAYRLIIKVARHNWRLLGVNLLTNLFSAVLEGSTLGVIYLAISFLTERSADPKHPQQLSWLRTFLPLDNTQIFFVLLAFAVVLQTLLSASNYCNKVTAASFSARVQPQVTGQVFERIMSFSFGHASRYKVGDLIKYTTSAASVVNIQITNLNNLVVSLSFALTYAFILLRLSPLLAVTAVGLTLIIVLVQRLLVPRIVATARSLMAAQIETSKYMTESIQAMRLLHTFGTQSRAINSLDKLLVDVQNSLQARARLVFLPESILEVLPVFALALLAAVAYSLSGTGEAILPMLLTFLLGLQRLAIRLRGVSGSFIKFADNTAGLDRLNSILQQDGKAFYSKIGDTFDCLKSDIVFKDVCLSYQDDDAYALKHLTFTIPRNKITALVGQSGAGKSSIVDLLTRVYEPTGGCIEVNNTRLARYAPHTWQQTIGVVSQDTFIFNCSILDNLRYGHPAATTEEVIAAAKSAQAHNFILEMPDGYDTVVGERGYRLSGGQRQRLALARAIIKQPELLILDEATSALDSESERLIQDALKEFQRDRTVVVVAHRLSTIAEADQILVLEKGALVEQGEHSRLIHQKGRYANYWSLQTQNIAV